MRARAALLIIPLLSALLVVPAVGSTVVDGGAHTSATTASAPPALQSDDSEIEQVFRINLTSDGDAEWTVTTRVYGLDTENERQAFRDLAAEAESGESDVGYSSSTFERFAADASAATGREMAIQNESWSSEIRNETGYISFEFTWTNFMRVEGDQLQLGDVFQTESGTWLPQLDEHQQLVINAPPGYAIESLNFETPPDGGFESGTVRWSGPATFESQDIQATFVPTGTGPTDGMPTGPSGTLVVVGGGLLAILGILAAGTYALRNRRDQVIAALPVGGASTESDETALPADDGEANEAPAGRLPGEDAAAESADVAPAARAPEGAEEDDSEDEESTDEEIDPELLSDEERIERMLRQNGGRMKQANIVTETGWSNAKVSQLLSSMDEEGRVDKLRIGRENLISLPDEDVTDVE